MSYGTQWLMTMFVPTMPMLIVRMVALGGADRAGGIADWSDLSGLQSRGRTRLRRSRMTKKAPCL